MLSETIQVKDVNGVDHNVDVLVHIDMAKAWISSGGITISDGDLRYLVDDEHLATRLPDGSFHCAALGNLKTIE